MKQAKPNPFILPSLNLGMLAIHTKPEGVRKSIRSASEMPKGRFRMMIRQRFTCRHPAVSQHARLRRRGCRGGGYGVGSEYGGGHRYVHAAAWSPYRNAVGRRAIPLPILHRRLRSRSVLRSRTGMPHIAAVLIAGRSGDRLLKAYVR